MAKFSASTIKLIGGFDQPVLAEEMLYGSDDYWNLTVNDGLNPPTAIDLTGWTVSWSMVRRLVDNLEDTRTGISFTNIRPAPGATIINLDSQIRIANSAAGLVRVLFNDAFFDEVLPDLDTDAPPVYTGSIVLTLPAVGTPGTPSYIEAQTKKIIVCVIVRSDGITPTT
jgi:hypothetical protein